MRLPLTPRLDWGTACEAWGLCLGGLFRGHKAGGKISLLGCGHHVGSAGVAIK